MDQQVQMIILGNERGNFYFGIHIMQLSSTFSPLTPLSLTSVTNTILVHSA